MGIKTVFVHCRNGILDLDTKQNRTIPKINYNLFLECQKNHSDLNLIPNGEINNEETINYLINQDISNFMIGRQFSKDILFIEKIGLCDLKNKKIFNFNAKFLTFKTISVTSSLTPLIDVNSCRTPSIWIEVTAAPLIEDSKILLKELPKVNP